VQQAAAANHAAVAAASAQQPAHTQQLLLQRQVAQESLLKRQYSNVSSPLGTAGMTIPHASNKIVLTKIFMNYIVWK
jgi:hypothetical protein